MPATDTERLVLSLLDAVRSGDSLACLALDDLFAEAGAPDEGFRRWPRMTWWGYPLTRHYFAAGALETCERAGLLGPKRASLNMPAEEEQP